MAVVLALDIGTSEICALAWDVQERRTIAVRTGANRSTVPGPEGRHEQDATIIRSVAIDLLGDLLNACAFARDDIRAIAITGQMHGVLLVDRSLEPLTNLITWRDARTTELANELVSGLSPGVRQSLGCTPAPGYGGLTLAWLVRHGRVPRSARSLGITDYIAASLCGVASTEPTTAASWGLYDLSSGVWHGETVDRFGLPTSILPQLQPSGRPLGVLDEAVRLRLDLPPGVTVCAPVGDNQASVLGTGADQPGKMSVNIGTGGQVSRVRPQAVAADGNEVRPMPFGGFLHVGASLSAGFAYAYLAGLFRDAAYELTGETVPLRSIYEKMNEWSESEAANGLVVHPVFIGTRLDPAQRGWIRGIDAGNLTPSSLTRAFVEGIVDELRELATHVGTDGVKGVIVAGNAVRRNRAFVPIISERFALPCEVSTDPEEAAVGAAIAAARGMGLRGTP